MAIYVSLWRVSLFLMFKPDAMDCYTSVIVFDVYESSESSVSSLSWFLITSRSIRTNEESEAAPKSPLLVLLLAPLCCGCKCCIKIRSILASSYMLGLSHMHIMSHIALNIFPWPLQSIRKCYFRSIDRLKSFIVIFFNHGIR